MAACDRGPQRYASGQFPGQRLDRRLEERDVGGRRPDGIRVGLAVLDHRQRDADAPGDLMEWLPQLGPPAVTAHTKLVSFASPSAATPVIEAAPLAALDLPWRVVV